MKVRYYAATQSNMLQITCCQLLHIINSLICQTLYISPSHSKNQAIMSWNKINTIQCRHKENWKACYSNKMLVNDKYLSYDIFRSSTETNFHFLVPSYTVSLGWFTCCQLVIPLFEVITVVQEQYFFCIFCSLYDNLTPEITTEKVLATSQLMLCLPMLIIIRTFISFTAYCATRLVNRS